MEDRRTRYESRKLYRSEREERRKNLKFERPQQVPLLGEIGISVFRHVERHGLDGAMRAFKELSADIITQPRGIGEEKEPAVNQLELREVRWNRTLLGTVAAQDALNAIYNKVPTVRRKLSVHPNGVALFGGSGAAVRPVCITFDKTSTDILAEERYGIHAALEGMTDTDPSSFQWIDSQPHLSLGKVRPNVSAEAIPKLISRLGQICLPELVLCRATLHNPYDNF
jgi:hypothetical protein